MPPNPFATGRQHVKPPQPAEILGESYVPGSPKTPAVITREYGDAFLLAETDVPNVERMLHAFKHPGMGLAVTMFLPRYFSPRLVVPTRTLARNPDPVHQAGAISGLISMLDTTAETRTFVRGLLHASSPAVRGRAAEYLCWFGCPDDYPFLTNYGILVSQEGGGPFDGKIHVGDDVAWRLDHETVVAIGDGVVRSVDLGRKSWGGLVVIEHLDASGGRFCSLYGHLGPLVCVRPGQFVRAGQKLGAVGTSFSHANGGYLAHLHFGIHRGAFLLPDIVGALVPVPGQSSGAPVTAKVSAVREGSVDVRLADGTTRTIERRDDWTCGYLKPAEFESQAHGWTDPQEFIRKHQ